LYFNTNILSERESYLTHFVLAVNTFLTLFYNLKLTQKVLLVLKTKERTLKKKILNLFLFHLTDQITLHLVALLIFIYCAHITRLYPRICEQKKGRICKHILQFLLYGVTQLSVYNMWLDNPLWNSLFGNRGTHACVMCWAKIFFGLGLFCLRVELPSNKRWS
jgi:hypothetical protein